MTTQATAVWVPIVDTPGVAHLIHPSRTVGWPHPGGQPHPATLCGQAAVHPVRPTEVRSHCTACSLTGAAT